MYNSRGDFMQGFLFGQSTREHFLKLMGSVMNNIEHKFIDIVSAKSMGCPRVRPGWVCDQPGLDPTLSGGGDFDPQPTRLKFQIKRVGSYRFSSVNRSV